ncbi:MAG: hypothetical protein FWG81_03045 [Betaproteobacteria bacterium]|nr:hypothetical protein [Betaproteobacteria bacterium]
MMESLVMLFVNVVPFLLIVLVYFFMMRSFSGSQSHTVRLLERQINLIERQNDLVERHTQAAERIAAALEKKNEID